MGPFIVVIYKNVPATRNYGSNRKDRCRSNRMELWFQSVFVLYTYIQVSRAWNHWSTSLLLCICSTKVLLICIAVLNIYTKNRKGSLLLGLGSNKLYKLTKIAVMLPRPPMPFYHLPPPPHHRYPPYRRRPPHPFSLPPLSFAACCFLQEQQLSFSCRSRRSYRFAPCCFLHILWGSCGVQTAGTVSPRAWNGPSKPGTVCFA